MRKMSVGGKWRKTKQTMSCNNQRAESSSQKKMIPRRRKSAAWNGRPVCQEHYLFAHPKLASLQGWMVQRPRAIAAYENCYCAREQLTALPPHVQSRPSEQGPIRPQDCKAFPFPDTVYYSGVSMKLLSPWVRRVPISVLGVHWDLGLASTE